MFEHQHFGACVVALSAVALAAAACTGGRRSDSSPATAGASVSPQRWSVRLNPSSGNSKMGSATITAVPEQRTRVSISVQGAPPNTNLPWHIHTGFCGGVGGPVLGSAGAYPMLGTAGDGRAQLQVDLNMPTPTGGSHHVDVHAGPGSDLRIACGDLVPAGDGDW